MGEISIKNDNLTIDIEKLKTLKSRVAASNIKPPAVVGDGTSIYEIEKIGKNYQDINEKIETLLSNTISFLENVKNSYQGNDNKAAKAYK